MLEDNGAFTWNMSVLVTGPQDGSGGTDSEPVASSFFSDVGSTELFSELEVFLDLS